MIYVDPACNINYCSFYLVGLWEVFGKKNVKFTSKYFKSLHYRVDSHCLAFIVDGKKYIIDYADSNQIFYADFLEWADIYGKVNYNPKYLPKKYKDKIKPISPNFGIANFGKNKWEALYHCLRSYIKCHNRLDYGFRAFLSPYLWLYKRYRLDMSPQKSAVCSKKIFMVSRWWKGQPWVNEARINFIRACRRLEKAGHIEFVGGMVPDTEVNDCPKDVLMNKEIPFDEYFAHLKDSLLVFNTPAYHHCHGWKLPEYLAMGKIILSTPFENELPVPMEHEKNIYFTGTSEDEIYQSLLKINSDKELQQRLQEDTVKYWHDYASPSATIKTFML